jgi:hypothetical protein
MGKTVEVFQGGRLNGRGFRSGLDALVAVDDRVIHAELGEAHGQGQAGGPGTDDQDIGLGGQCGHTLLHTPSKENRSGAGHVASTGAPERARPFPHQAAQRWVSERVAASGGRDDSKRTARVTHDTWTAHEP